MPFEQYKTQVLLLHSQQSTLDVLSTGFNDRYAVHCATSGTEALNTLGDTPIHVIVSAQDLPGMSGLEALREAKKRSPDTIAILLAGTDASDGLEALVGDQEVYQIVRGEISPEALLDLIENATKSVRILALSEASNDTAANVDEPYAEAEHIVMETAENGSVIISDGTGTVPVLRPDKIQVSPNASGQSVDVLVLTKDEEFLATIRESSRGMHNVHHSVTPSQAEDIVRDHSVGVLVTDAAMVGSNIEALTQRLRVNSPRLVAIVAGRRDDGELLMDLINRGQVYRFLLKPVSPGRARLAIEASVKHHLEAADSAFAGKARGAAPPPVKPAPAPKPAPQPKAAPKPAPKPAPRPAPKPAPQPKPIAKKAAAKKAAAAKARAAPPPQAAPRKEPKISAPQQPPQPARKKAPTIEPIRAQRDEESPISDGLDDAFEEANSFTETMTGIAVSVGKSLSGAAESLKNRKQEKEQEQPTPPASPASPSPLDLGSDDSSGLLRNPKILAIAAGVVVVGLVSLWMFSGDDAAPGDSAPVANESQDAGESVAPGQAQPVVSEPAPQTSGPTRASGLLEDARDARARGDIYSPAGQNAVEYLVMARDAAPTDTNVQAELDAIIDEVFGLAETAVLENRYTDASRALRVIGLADPGNPRLSFLNAQLSQQQLRSYLDDARNAIRERRFEDAGRFLAQAEATVGASTPEIDALSAELANARSEQRIEDVLALASQRLDEDSLTAPSNDNARYYFQLALTSDPGNAAARQGLIAVASKLVLRARAEIDAGNFDAAESLLGDARALDPSSGALAAASDALDGARAAQAASAQAAADQEAERIAAERRAAAEREAEAERQAAAEQLRAEQEAAAAEAAAPPQDTANDKAAPTVAAATVTNDAAATTPEPRRLETVSISALERTKYVAPRYPRAAQRRNASGFVDVAFTVTTDGTVKDIDVTDSRPGTLFNDAAIEAVERWEFEPPRTSDGQMVEKRVAVRMSFALQ